jgi:Peptidase family M1 domain
VRVEPDRRLAEGDLRVAFRPDTATDHLVFRLWPNAPPQRQESADLSVSDVRSLDSVHSLTTSTPNPTTLDVVPRPPLAAGDRIDVGMRWRLRLPGRVLDRLSTGPDLAILGSFFPILAWQPGKGWATDPPTTALAEAGTAPTADFDVRIHTVPLDLRVLATGVQIGPGHWRARAVRDFALAAGRFSIAKATVSLPHSATVTVAVQTGIHIGGPAFARRVAGALVDLRAAYGPYPWPGLGVVVTPNLGRSGIEYPNLIFEGAEGLQRVTTHEVAHQWFYSLVGNDQARDPWLDEALATYTSSRRDGFLPFFQGLHVRGVARDHVGAPMTFWDRHATQYEPGVYFRGVQALLSLGSPELIDCALRAYVANHAFEIATPDDLLEAFSVVFPDARERLARFGIP